MSNLKTCDEIKRYWAYFDCGNDIVTERIKAKNIKEAKKKAQALKKKYLQNDRRIKTTVRFKQ